jgi:hypothetical protein
LSGWLRSPPPRPPPRVAEGRVNRLELRWTASDRNLLDKPISLAWSARPEGPWRTIADKLANTGSYRWTVPGAVPAKVYLKLTVRDAAGNVSEAKSDLPVLIDLAVPGDVTIKGVR